MAALPQARPTAGGTSFLDDILEFGRGAIGLVFDYKTQQNEASIASDLRASEALKLAQINSAQGGNTVTPDSTLSASGGFTMPSWAWPVLIVGGVGLVAFAAFKK